MSYGYRSFVSKIVFSILDRIRLFIFYLRLDISTPSTLFSLIFTISTILWGIYTNFRPNFQLNREFFTNPINVIFGIIFILFFLIIFSTIKLMYPSAKRAKIIVDAYGSNPRIIPFIAKDVKMWLENTPGLIKQQKKISDIQRYVRSEDIDMLEKLRKKLFLISSINKKNSEKNERRGNYLDILITGVSDSFGIPRESFEDLINTRIDINQKISKELISSYDQIKVSIEGFVAAKKDRDVVGMRRHEKKIQDNCDKILKKGDGVENQIKWIEELDRRKWAIPMLIEIIKESSTGNALSKLTKLLSDARVENIEDMKWLIQFANSRKGFSISELLGLKFVDNENLFSLDKIPGKDGDSLIEFLKQNFNVE
ncbi:MAG: hypothetical protein FIB07_08345 [Candidatus Methanoperedens sp.]|nr:hypothetical protein [Candidatus Methanoperedens sp.]